MNDHDSQIPQPSRKIQQHATKLQPVQTAWQGYGTDVFIVVVIDMTRPAEEADSERSPTQTQSKVRSRMDAEATRVLGKFEKRQRLLLERLTKERQERVRVSHEFTHCS